MVKTELNGIYLFSNARYTLIFNLIKKISEKGLKVRYKDLKYCFLKNSENIKPTKGVLFEEIDRKKSEKGSKISLKLGELTEKQFNYFMDKEKKIKDYNQYFRLRYLKDKKDYIFNSKQSLSNTLNLLRKKKIIDKDKDKKGNYYFITDYGLFLFQRFYSQWLIEHLPEWVENLPDKKMESFYNKLLKLF